MSALLDYFGMFIVYINMIILFLVVFLAIRLYRKYSKYIEVKKKYVQKQSEIFK